MGPWDDPWTGKWDEPIQAPLGGDDLLGKSTGKLHISWEKRWFPEDFPLNQTIVEVSCIWIVPLTTSKFNI